jgi:hypothetical protein
MESLSYESFINIASFVYNLEDSSSFITLINQFAPTSKTMNALTVQNRTFLEDFYYSLFPSVVIPPQSIHTTDDPTTCKIVYGRSRLRSKYYDGVKRFIDENGYHHHRIFDYSWMPYTETLEKTKYRCKNPQHYSDLEKRFKISRYKDLYTRCRDKYINDWCRESKKSVRFINQNSWNYDRAKELIKEYELNQKMVKNRTRLLKLKDDYENDKRNKKKRKT